MSKPITPAEAAKLLGRSPTTIRRLARQNNVGQRLPAPGGGALHIYSSADIAKLNRLIAAAYIRGNFQPGNDLGKLRKNPGRKANSG